VACKTNPYFIIVFLSKLDPTNGQPWKSTAGVQRYSLGNTIDTYIEAICSSSGRDGTELVIVGRYVDLAGSQGDQSKSIAYLALLDATTLETIWHQDLIFTLNAYGLACSVQGGQVYVAGIVENGGTYGSQTTSLGKDDLFAARYQMNDGHMDWIRQVGTQGNDRLAHGGSGLLLTVSQHNVTSVVLF
jgi:hypothetical protein